MDFVLQVLHVIVLTDRSVYFHSILKGPHDANKVRCQKCPAPCFDEVLALGLGQFAEKLKTLLGGGADFESMEED